MSEARQALRGCRREGGRAGVGDPLDCGVSRGAAGAGRAET